MVQCQTILQIHLIFNFHQLRIINCWCDEFFFSSKIKQFKCALIKFIWFIDLYEVYKTVFVDFTTSV